MGDRGGAGPEGSQSEKALKAGPQGAYRAMNWHPFPPVYGANSVQWSQLRCVEKSPIHPLTESRWACVRNHKPV